MVVGWYNIAGGTSNNSYVHDVVVLHSMFCICCSVTVQFCAYGIPLSMNLCIMNTNICDTLPSISAEVCLLVSVCVCLWGIPLVIMITSVELVGLSCLATESTGWSASRKSMLCDCLFSLLHDSWLWIFCCCWELHDVGWNRRILPWCFVFCLLVIHGNRFTFPAAVVLCSFFLCVFDGFVV